jgi:metal-responsive CopG/Arc/MetJ family transcriptional regulator
MATKTFNLAMEEKLLKKVDSVVKQEMASRSEYFRRLVLSDLSRRETLLAILDAGNKKGKALKFKSEDDALRAMSLK